MSPRGGDSNSTWEGIRIMGHEQNLKLTKRFNELFAGGHSNFRIAIEASEHRVFLTRAEGSHLWDVDGNEYIDYLNAMGPTILGHRHPEYTSALKDHLGVMSTAIGSGVFFTPQDVELAEKLVKHIPCAEKVKLCLSGSEAVQMAIRLGRAYTRRPYFIRFGDHYHGWLDNVMGGVVDEHPTGKPFGAENKELDMLCYTEGKSRGALQESFLLPWNDIERLEEVLKRHGEEVAIIHFEGIVFNHFALMPRPGFLEKMRELCTRYGIVMSMDEVISGFRVGLGGAQGYLGITPDLSTFGKAMAGGLPFSAVVGKADILDQLKERKVLGPGTFNGHPLGVRAALTTLSVLERGGGAAYKEMARVQKRLTDGLSDLAKKHGITMSIQGVTGGFFTLFGVEKTGHAYTNDDLKDLDIWKLFDFWKKMQEEGIIVMAGGRWYMSIAHTDKDIDRTLEAADRSMAKM